MRFLIDANLPPALARELSQLGHDAEHVADRGLQAATDNAIWELGLALTAAIVTKDEDFARRKTLDPSGPVIIWIRLPNTRRRQLLARFAIVLPEVIAAIERGETLIEVA